MGIPVAMCLWAASVGYTRVALTQDHTVPQVVAGAALGTLFALGWHHLTTVTLFGSPIR